MVRSLIYKLFKQESERRSALIEAAIDETVKEIHYHQDSDAPEFYCRVEDGILHVYNSIIHIAKE